MIVWLWDAPGPASTACGVSGEETAAREAAEACMLAGQARGARVEQARLVIEAATLASVYRRTGSGWEARRSASGIRWVPIQDAA